MIRYAVLAGTAALLAAGDAAGQDRPAARQPAGAPPADLHARLAQVPLPALASAANVKAFVDAASAVPVARREEVRALVARTRENGEIANALIAEFETAQKTDFSRALVALSLIGEQRHPAGTAYLARFLRQPRPGGKPTAETGISVEAETLERLQVKAANALPYARTPQAMQATLEVVRGHPSKAVRIEAASSYLWNAGNSEEARRTLSQVLRKDELLVLDRPVREEGMTAEQFNRQLALYLDRHPEARAPAPSPGRPRGTAPEEKTATPPSETSR